MLAPAAVALAGATAGRLGTAPPPAWVAAYVPFHLKPGLLWAPRAAQRVGPGTSIRAVSFARGGADLLASYVGEAVYGFDQAAHARDLKSLLAIDDLWAHGKPW